MLCDPSEFNLNHIDVRLLKDKIGNSFRWTGKAEPRLSCLIGFRNPPSNKKIHSSIIISITTAKSRKLEENNSAYLRRLEGRTGCAISLGPEPRFGPPIQDSNGRWVISKEAFHPKREIRFFGTVRETLPAIAYFDEVLENAAKEK